MSRTRRNSWESHLREKGKTFLDPFATSSRSRRVARQKKALNIKRVLPFECANEEIDGDIHYFSNMGAHLIVGDCFVTLKMPYGLSINDIWRATIDEKGVQRNSLSLSARNYKKNISSMYKPLLESINFQKISQLCEIRIIAQPPAKQKNFSARTYPRYDIDNYPKIIIDSLKNILFHDDNIFVREQIQFAEPVPDGCVWLSCIFIDDEKTDWINHRVNFDWLAGREHGI